MTERRAPVDAGGACLGKPPPIDRSGRTSRALFPEHNSIRQDGNIPNG